MQKKSSNSPSLKKNVPNSPKGSQKQASPANRSPRQQQAQKPSPRRSSNSPGRSSLSPSQQQQQQQQKPRVQQLQQSGSRTGPLLPKAPQKENNSFKSIQYVMNKSNFADDYPVIIADVKQQKETEYDLNKNLFLEVRAKSNKFQLNEEIGELPVMITIRTADQEQDQDALQQQQENVTLQHAKLEQKSEQAKRSCGIDLICVIDHSGSMTGVKIQLVRQTLHYMLEQLQDIDRLCLIQFDDTCHRLCPFVTMTQNNKDLLKDVINKIQADGGTDICFGMNCAFDVIKQRRQENTITSIFLLSDGLDGGAEKKVEQSIYVINNLKYYINQKNFPLLQTKVFTIHSFGFGEDHDPQLMNKIASLKDGNFYFIQDLSKLDECFINALGALFSVVAQNIKISIQIQQNNVDAKCVKTFGNMWNTLEDQNYLIQIPQLISGISKDFIMLLQIPIYQGAPFTQFNRDIRLVVVKLTCNSQDKQFVKEKSLNVQFFNKNEDIGEVDEDGEVMENFCRVEAASAIEQAMQNLNQGNFEQGQQIIDKAIIQIEKSKLMKKVNVMKLEVLQKDLVESKKQCEPQVYNKYGKHNMIMMQKCHMEQKSKGINYDNDDEDTDFYANKKQKVMVKSLKSKKANF